MQSLKDSVRQRFSTQAGAILDTSPGWRMRKLRAALQKRVWGLLVDEQLDKSQVCAHCAAALLHCFCVWGFVCFVVVGFICGFFLVLRAVSVVFVSLVCLGFN